MHRRQFIKGAAPTALVTAGICANIVSQPKERPEKLEPGQVYDWQCSTCGRPVKLVTQHREYPHCRGGMAITATVIHFAGHCSLSAKALLSKELESGRIAYCGHISEIGGKL